MNDPDSVLGVPASRLGRRFRSSAIAEGIERQMIWGERLMVCRLRFAPHVVTAVHSHPHEQITLVERGRVRLHRRRPGAHRLRPATCCTSRRDIRHGATMLDEEVVLIDIFSPIREDFLPGRRRR